MKLNIARLIVSIFICESAGAIGSLFTAPAIATWYATLAKPSFSPPNWLFGPVWIMLYILMGVAFYFAWNKGFGKSKIALYAFSLQLALNALWSVVFFGLRSPFYGLLTIITLWAAILATIITFYKISKQTFWLLLPYMAWVSFAAVLNFYVWSLNFAA